MLSFKGSLLFIFLLISISSSPSPAATKNPKSKTAPIENELGTSEDLSIPEFDELIDHKWPALLGSPPSRYFPRMNIQESEDSYHIEAELPGVKKDEVEIKLKDDYLVISGEKKSMHKEIKNQYRRIERANGSFYRAVSIPRNINKDKITAELTDGILKVDIAKIKNSPQSVEKKILIK